MGLLIGLPAADDTIALSKRRAKLAKQLAAHAEAVAMIPQIEELAAQRRQQAAGLSNQTVSLDQLHLFRGRVVELSRQAGCQVRQIQLGERRVRDWRKDSDPLALVQRSGQEVQGPYVLAAQSFTVSVSGRLENVKQFFKRLFDQRLIMHTMRLNLKPSSEGSEVVLELEILLFEVTHAQRTVA
jgi:hypothetical protein